MTGKSLRAWMDAKAADWADVVSYAHQHLQQPGLDYWLQAEPAYFRAERNKAAQMGHWPKVGTE